jgi:pimeloyl-ACP methyl ester carboxylesterase
MENQHSILQLPDNNYIAYRKTEGKKNKPMVIFLGGFMSDMTGDKATALEKFCLEKGYGFIRFDYIGHGQSSGEFTDGTIGIWRENVLSVIDELTSDPLVLIGSSMGGWLMLLAALERPKHIKGLIGIASAPDFTENLIWEKMSDEIKAELKATGIHRLKSEYGESPYPITLNLIEEARNHLVLHDKININCPVRLIHGMEDEDVPSSLSVKLGEQLTTENMCVHLIAKGNHRMSTPENIQMICNTLEEMVDSFGGALQFVE